LLFKGSLLGLADNISRPTDVLASFSLETSAGAVAPLIDGSAGQGTTAAVLTDVLATFAVSWSFRKWVSALGTWALQ
jgi:hypothetical protein